MTTPRAEKPTLRAFLGSIACRKSTSTTTNLGLFTLEGGLTESDQDVQSVVNAAIDALDAGGGGGGGGTAADTSYVDTYSLGAGANVQDSLDEAIHRLLTKTFVTFDDETGDLPGSKFVDQVGNTVAFFDDGGQLAAAINPHSINETHIQANCLDDSLVYSAAAIAGTKIAPNFGAQTVQTTGTVQGAIVLGKGSGTGTSGYLDIEDNDGSVGARSYLAEVTTTDATVTSIATILPPLGVYAMYVISAVFTAMKSDGSSGFSVTKAATCRNNSGTFVQVGSTTTPVAAVGDACDATIDVSGGDIRFRVTGIAATNYRWGVLVTRMYRTNGTSGA